jgi:hypothetical protein
MHCKSLITNSLVTTMNMLSFFSNEFKIIYIYKHFQKYITTLIEKSKFNAEWLRIKDNMQVGMK